MFPIPFNDEQRLKALGGYDVLDTPPEEAFDSLTRLAVRHFGAPVALVSLVDEARQWFKSVQGLDVRETDREQAFCGHAIMSDEPMIVLDAATDSRFASNTLVCDDPGIRFYAGVPLVTPHGFRLGTFCIIGFAPRTEFTDDQVSALRDFAAAAMQSLNARRLAYAQQNGDEARIAEDSSVDLFSTVAHEIRSPITALQGCLSAIEGEIYGPIGDHQYGELVAAMSETIEQVMSMTDRMLNFARIRNGDIELVEEWTPVPSLLEKAQRILVSAQDNQKPDIRIGNAGANILLNADSILIAQMLGNLIGNAIKYSNGRPSIELSATCTGTGALEITVSDAGIGMRPEDLSCALQPYVQVHRSRKKSVGGIGIGLPLVKQLIEVHGGRLQIASAENKGTKVTLLFPAYRVRTDDEVPPE